MPGFSDSKPASEALAMNRVVTIDLAGGNVGKVRYPDNATERIYGSTSQSISAAQITAGRLNASLMLPGPVRILAVDGASGAVVAGDLLMAQANTGKLIKHDGTGTNIVAGQAMEDISVDGEIPVKLIDSVEEAAVDAA